MHIDRLSLIGRAFAAGVPVDVADITTKGAGDAWRSLGNIFYAVTNIVLYVGIALTVIFLIMGGIRYITSGGSKEGAEAARSNITNAIIGFIVVLGAIALRLIIANVLGGAESLQLPGWFTSTT